MASRAKVGPRVRAWAGRTLTLAVVALAACELGVRAEPDTSTGGDSEPATTTGPTTGAPTSSDATGDMSTETGVEAPPPCEPVAIAAGDQHTCAVLADGSARCWGRDGAGDVATGRLGYRGVLQVGGASGSPLAELPPLPLNPALVGTPQDVVAGALHSCLRTDADEVLCWGRGALVGDGHTSLEPVYPDEAAPLRFPSGDGGWKKIASLQAGGEFTCAQLVGAAGDELRCWGVGLKGQLGTGATETVYDAAAAAPIECPPAGALRTVAAGDYHACAVLDAGGVGSIACWGVGLDGVHGRHFDPELEGAAILSPSLAPGHLLGAAALDMLIAGRRHTCALLGSSDEVRCWGVRKHLGGYGTELPDGVEVVPWDDDATGGAAVRVELGGGLSLPRPLAAGRSHSCARYEERTVRCWGLGTHRKLGFTACQGPGDDECAHGDDEPVIAHESRLCFTDAALKGVPCEQTMITERRVPLALALGSEHSCVLLRRDGEDGPSTAARCWGDNATGALGYPLDGDYTAAGADDLEFMCQSAS